jgi:uncharacterized protein YdcH (DUF465 family)
MSRERKLDVQVQINRLQRRHDELKTRIAELDSHFSLSSHEQLRVTELKKERLAAKDALVGLQYRRPSF